MTKLTKRTAFTAIAKALALVEFEGNEDYIGISYDELQAFLDKEVKALDKPRTESKADKARKEATALATELVVSVLAGASDKMTIPELIASRSEFDGFSSQKMASILRGLATSGVVTKELRKRIAYYGLTENAAAVAE